MTPEQIETLPYRPCVGVVLAHADGRVFAGQRKGHNDPAWQMPQGGIDPGETPQEAALRELEEETGVPAELVTLEAQTPDWITYDLPIEIVPKRWGGRFRGQKQLWFLLRFHGQDTDIRIDTADPEFSDWTWLSSDEMAARIVPFKRAIYQTVFTAFAKQLR